MSAPADWTPIALPAPVDRRVRLGPFPNPHAALRFVVFAAAGAVVAAAAGPVAWLPFLGGGFVLTAGRTDGKTLDERVGDYVRWRWRRHGDPPRRPRPPLPAADGSVARLLGGRLVAVVEAGGVPVQFLPPAEARALFEGYRDLLGSLEDGVVERIGSEPIPSAPFDPGPGPAGLPDARARAGYAEMVRLLCRRRRRRTVDLVVWSAGTDRRPPSDLDGRVAALEARLGALGLAPRRLRGSGLVRALDRLGWTVEALA
jgi:hypothetical protein